MTAFNPVKLPGTTSACAENTPDRIQPCETAWNYLRVRGEYPPHHPTGSGYRELPPRARRIQKYGTPHDSYQGTTSACAENTTLFPLVRISFWNYLRVRGEYPK